MFSALILILAVITWLAFAFSGTQTDWVNFSSFAAIVFYSAVFFIRKTAFLISIIAILVSDIILNTRYQLVLSDTGTFSWYFSLGIIFMLGFWVRKQQQYKLLYLFLFTVVITLIFYIVTHTDAWLILLEYKKNLAGWVQALILELPEYLSALFSLRNMIVNDLLLIGLFVAIQTVFAKSTVTLPVKNPAFTLN